MTILIWARDCGKKYSQPEKIDSPVKAGITPRNRVYSRTVPFVTRGYIPRINGKGLWVGSLLFNTRRCE